MLSRQTCSGRSIAVLGGSGHRAHQAEAPLSASDAVRRRDQRGGGNAQQGNGVAVAAGARTRCSAGPKDLARSAKTVTAPHFCGAVGLDPWIWRDQERRRRRIMPSPAMAAPRIARLVGSGTLDEMNTP